MRAGGIFIFPFVMLALIAGISGGWVRLGWTDLVIPQAAKTHGLLMTGAFLGSLISLERTIIMKNAAWLFVPLSGALSAPLFLLGYEQAGIYALILASAGLVLLLYLQALRYQLKEQWFLLIGGACWLIGNILVVKTGFIAVATSWWIAFILFTIAAERLELSKFLPTPRWATYFLYLILLLFLSGLFILFHTYGNWFMGFGAIMLGFWLLKFDMARISVKKSGHYRYIGTGLIIGYCWLIIFGLILCFLTFHSFYYDLFLHSFFLGFAFSMIWAHAPIILPAVLKIRHTPYHPFLWIIWILFQLTLAGRILFTLLDQTSYRKFFGVINGWLIFLMFAAMGGLMIRYLRTKSLKGQN